MSTDPVIAGAPASLDVLAASGSAPPPAAPTTGDYVVPASIDLTRQRIAYLLLWIMIGIMVVIILVSLAYSIGCWRDVTQCTAASNALGVLTSSISPIFTAMVGLVGSVVGFYFGSKNSDETAG